MKPSAILKDLVDKTEEATAIAQDDVRDIFAKAIDDFYGEYEPRAYVRKFQLPKTLQESAVRGSSTGLGHECDIYLDPSMMSHPKGLVPLKWGNSKTRTGWSGYGYATWGEEKILAHAARGSHGGRVYGTGIWHYPLGKVRNRHKSILAKACRQAGIPI